MLSSCSLPRMQHRTQRGQEPSGDHLGDDDGDDLHGGGGHRGCEVCDGSDGPGDLQIYIFRANVKSTCEDSFVAN